MHNYKVTRKTTGIATLVVGAVNKDEAVEKAKALRDVACCWQVPQHLQCETYTATLADNTDPRLEGAYGFALTDNGTCIAEPYVYGPMQDALAMLKDSGLENQVIAICHEDENVYVSIEAVTQDLLFSALVKLGQVGFNTGVKE